MRRAWILMAMIAVGCSAPAPAPTSPAPVVIAPVALEPPAGRVLEYGTLAPVEGASVSFFVSSTVSSANPPPAVASVVTGATGGYWVQLPPNSYLVSVDDVFVRGLTVEPGRPHGDIIARAGDCSATYGYVTDATTGAPLAGAVVTLANRQATSTATGWYLVDFGCNLGVGGNTTFINFARAGYTQQTPIYGRGVRGMRRYDAALMPE